MRQDYRALLPTNFSKSSRIWIYQGTRIFSIGEAIEVEARLEDFVKDWQSHGAPVRAAALLLFGQFIILIADETKAPVGGCSTDASVRMIKQIEQTYKVSLFDRSQLAFLVKDKVELLPLAQFEYALEKEFLTKETLYFNNTISNLAELENSWIVPIEKSWLKQKLR